MIALEKNNPQPLYAQVKEGLRKEVLDGVYPSNQPIPEERVLAAQLHLSRTTVRRAILELTGEGFFDRIRGRGTFVRRSVIAAQGHGAASDHPAQARPFTLAVISNSDRFKPEDGLFYYRILHAIQNQLGQDACVVLRRLTAPFEAWAQEMRNDRSIDAFVGIGIVDPDVLRAMRTIDRPTVLVDCVQDPVSPVFDEVTHDGEDAACEAVSSLLDLGHRDVGIMIHGAPTGSSADMSTADGWKITLYARQRRRGFDRAMAAVGVDPDPARKYPVLPSSSTAYARMRALLRTGDVPTAVICTTDEIAIGVIQAVKDHGWRVPEHLSVIGFGDAGYFCTPPLSTVRIPVDEIGAATVTVLRERAKDPSAPLRKILVPTRWVPRATCDIPRT
ncbi:MAG: substrate-binding domain-containing protein [Planctomycetes bacterium]|nr:substrate-binding domain-containing protein [Planctomycetota bacterium]